MIYAPIVIPTLSRYEHFVRLIESLIANPWAKYTEMYVAVDDAPAEKYKSGRKKILQYLNSEELKTAFKDVHIIERERNYGSLWNGYYLIEDIANKENCWICLQDDLEVSPNFIEYMDKCLEKYKDDDKVMAICGYSYPVDWKLSKGANCFRQQINCAAWGLGLWKDKYRQMFEDMGSGKLLNEYPNVIKNGLYRKMIDACKREYVEAACYKWSYGHQWFKVLSDIALRAYLAVYDKYAITPAITKVKNYGFDGSGDCCEAPEDGKVDSFAIQQMDTSSTFEIVESEETYAEENRVLLNILDSRTDEQMQKSKRLIWLSSHVGVWSAKLYCLLSLPYDFAIRAYNKYIRK